MFNLMTHYLNKLLFLKNFKLFKLWKTTMKK